MGFFSGKKITTVSTTTNNLVEYVDPIPGAVITSIFEGSGLPETILKAILSGMGTKSRRAQNYARESYALGLPTGQLGSVGSVSNTDLAVIIAADINHPDGVYVESNHYTTVSPGLMVLDDLITIREYDIGTNEINILPVDAVWTPWCTLYENTGTEESPELVCISTATPEQIELAPKRMTIQSIYFSDDELSADVTYLQQIKHSTWGPWVEDGTYFESYLIPDVANIAMEDDAVYAEYFKLDALGTIIPEPLIWVYVLSYGTYPSLDLVENTAGVDEFLAVTPIRYNNVDYTDPTRDTPDPLDLYTTSKTLMKKWSFDFNYFGELLNDNPDIGSIDHAYVMFGTHLQTEVSGSLLYLTKLFDQLYQSQVSSKTDYFNKLSDPSILQGPQNSYLTSVVGGTGNFGESGLDLKINYDYITSESIVGTIGNGKIGNARKSWTPYEVAIPRRRRFWGSEGDADNWITTYTYETRYKLILEAQDAKRIIKRITVAGLQTKNTIYNGYSVITTLKTVATDPTNKSLIIPVNYSLAQEMRLLPRNALYADASLMVINTWDVQKTKWYSSGWFKILIIIVAVVLIVITGGAASFMASVAAAATAGAVALTLFFLQMVFVALLINYATKWLVTTFGAKLGIIGAVLLVVASVVIAIYAPQTAQFLMQTAQMMMQVASALISAVNEFLMEEGAGILDEYKEFREELSDQYEELQTTLDLLDNKVDIDPLTFTRPRWRMNPNDEPGKFFQRTLGLAENTYYVKEYQIPNFVNSALTLDRKVSTELYNMNVA